ncbi:MAG: ABC transporter permease [Alphaproteobacteria bacterium]
MWAFIFTLLITITPYILAALGELICERSGVLNLGVSGMMLFGAVCAAIVGVSTGSWPLAMLASMLGAMLIASVFAFVVLVLQANQVASGLALTFFGSGLAALLGKAYVGKAVPASYAIPLWGNYSINSLTIITFILLVITGIFLNKTRYGLVLRAVGENHHSAHSLGWPVIKIRLLAIWFGAAMAGLAGSSFVLVSSHAWSDGDITSGRGWIALALVVFSTWRVSRVFWGALLFGGLDILQLRMQDQIPDFLSHYINSYTLQAIPYIATIVVLVLISHNKMAVRINTPACLGKNFHASR